ncbi:hypothetical protein FF38_09217 [Lucilia cuprina]|uniref:Uncharacterized protein n=1 Tax=Lucilia cuprina TaxID=7375 RepID=A0A0L0CKL7_LUCCU|nr:hypothetical protein FF38_09217 [Lucilia cuprina]
MSSTYLMDSYFGPPITSVCAVADSTRPSNGQRLDSSIMIRSSCQETESREHHFGDPFLSDKEDHSGIGPKNIQCFINETSWFSLEHTVHHSTQHTCNSFHNHLILNTLHINLFPTNSPNEECTMSQAQSNPNLKKSITCLEPIQGADTKSGENFIDAIRTASRHRHHPKNHPSAMRNDYDSSSFKPKFEKAFLSVHAEDLRSLPVYNPCSLEVLVSPPFSNYQDS